MMGSFFKNYLSSNNISSVVSYKNYGGSNVVSGDYGDLCEHGYKNNVVVYRCIHIISRAISSVDWVIKKTNKDSNFESIKEGEILNLLKRPNAKQAGSGFIESCISYLLLSGNCYVSAVKDEFGKVLELHVLRPDRVRVIPSGRSVPAGYEYTVGHHKEFFPIDPDNGFSNLVHIKLFNPTDDWYGMSPLSVAMGAVKQHNAIAKQNVSFLQNGGRPSGALVYKNSLDPVRRESLRSDLKNAYEGGHNAGKILLLEGDFEWKEMGLSPKDLDFTSGKSLSAKEIALAFGVPSILIGETEDATFSNYKEARYNFWEETVLPLLNLFVGEFSNWLGYLFAENFSVTYDIDSIQALSARRESEWKRINEATFLNIDEKRESLGYAHRKIQNN